MCVQGAENAGIAQQQQLDEKSTQLVGVKRELRDLQQAHESTMKVLLQHFYAVKAAVRYLWFDSTVWRQEFKHASMLCRHAHFSCKSTLHLLLCTGNSRGNSAPSATT